MNLEGNVLITGGAGFLARAIYRRARREGWSARFTALSRDDAKHAALAKRFPEVRTIRADVAGGIETLIGAFAGHETVIHAAAAKYVDRSELAAFDTVRVNIEGSRDVALAAARAGVERVVGISTDKACAPANVYGMSKAVMERLFQEAGGWYYGPKFTAVRYGNVVGSTGSIVPVFREQAERTGAVTVTDPSMTRFWMGVDDAIDLILFALREQCPPGFVAVPSPTAMNIGDVARAVAPRARVDVVGIRPGEKRHETLVTVEEGRRLLRMDGGWPGTVYVLGDPSYVSPYPEGPLRSDTATRMTPDEFAALVADAEDV